MNLSEIARPFVPTRLLAQVRDDGAITCMAGVVLLADLANFTGLTEALTAKAGADGGELVGRDLNEVLAPAIDAVVRADGDVVKFAGDGLLCIFPRGLEAVEDACRAGQEIARATVRGPTGETHRFRVAIVYGTVLLARVGGHRGRYEFVAGGEAVDSAQELIRGVEPGTVGPTKVLPAAPAVAYREAASPIDPLSYLPEFVVARLSEELSEWLQELRTLTIVFAAARPDGAERSLHEIARSIQVIADGQGGQLLRFSVEGHCLVGEIAFGLPVGTSATGPREALQCAVALVRQHSGMQVGVSTGRVLLGPVGSSARRQLTCLGTTVNLAARLMQHAAPDQVLVDEATWAAADGRFTGFRSEAALKGLGVRAYWRLGDFAPVLATPDDELFGRELEIQTLREALDASRHIVIVGEAGIGKSRLCRWLVTELRARGVNPWITAGTPVGRDTPYSGLAGAISELCGLREGGNDEQRLREVAGQLLGDADRAPLLSDALGLSLPDTDQTRTLAGPVRAENIREALLSLFRQASRQSGAALVVEDTHWLDATSWTLLQRLAGEVDGLRIVIVSRPLPGAESAQWAALLARHALTLHLGPLPAEDIEAVVARRMDVREVPAALGWVVDRARGNPFFAQELASMLVSVGKVEIRDGVPRHRPGSVDFDQLPLVPAIESVLEQRIDSLGVEEAVALKVASVIGPTFGLDALGDLTRRPGGGSAVLSRLAAAGMVVPAGPGQFSFRHRYTQEAAYRMLPGDKRRDLHRRVAGWFEQRLGDRAEERASELAHHWFNADDRPKAVQWLEYAGVQALRTGADREAATQFVRVLSIGEGQPAGRLAAWRRQLARAMFGLGEIEGVASEARTAVELVAGPLPTSPLRWTALSVRAALGRLLSRSGLPRGRTAEVEALLEGARAAGLLAEAAYFLNAPEMMVGSALVAVGLAERTPSAAPVSVAYGMLGVVAGMARMHRTARRYLTTARSLSEAADDPYQLGVAWFYTGLYLGCIGNWTGALDAVERALDITERLGADMQSGFQFALIATNALYTSEYDKARRWMKTVEARAERSANVQQLGWACNIMSVADLHQGAFDSAIERSERARKIFLVERDLVSLIISEGIQCAALARSGQMARALAGAGRATALVATARPTTWGQLEGFSGPCEVYALAMLQGVLPREAVPARAAPALKGLRLFALVFPFGRARYHWIQGLFALASADKGRARRRLKKAIAVAGHFSMAYEELRATELLAPLAEHKERVELEARAEFLRSLVRDGTPADRRFVALQRERPESASVADH